MTDRVLTLHMGDVIFMKKKHPCGSVQWAVIRLGSDIGLVCAGCGRRQLMGRSALAKRLKAIDHSTHDNS